MKLCLESQRSPGIGSQMQGKEEKQERRHMVQENKLVTPQVVILEVFSNCSKYLRMFTRKFTVLNCRLNNSCRKQISCIEAEISHLKEYLHVFD